MLLLKASIFGVCPFIFFFSLLFGQQQDILMFFALTGFIYLGWAGSAIIGGLYWKRWFSRRWSASIVGVLLAIAGWYVTYEWASSQQLIAQFFPAVGRRAGCGKSSPSTPAPVLLDHADHAVHLCRRVSIQPSDVRYGPAATPRRLRR